MPICPKCGGKHDRGNEGMICRGCLEEFRHDVERDQKDQEAIKKIMEALRRDKEK